MIGLLVAGFPLFIVALAIGHGRGGERSGGGDGNANFSVPEINDLKAGLKTITQLGDFSTIDFTLVGLGEPRVVRAGVVNRTPCTRPKCGPSIMRERCTVIPG